MIHKFKFALNGIYCFLICLCATDLYAANDTTAQDATLTFSWPVPGKVRVTETALKKGRTAVFQYDLITKPVANSRDIEVSYRRFEFVSIQGLDLNSAEIRQKLAPTLAIMSALPSFRINPKGELLEVIGFEEMLQRVLDTSLLAGNIDAKVRNKVISMLSEPTTIATLKEKTANYWDAWVGAWIGLPNKPGAVYNLGGEYTAFGANVPYAAQIKQLKTKGSSKPGKVSFRLTSQADGDAMKNAVAGLMHKTITGKSSSRNTFDLSMIQFADRTTTIGIVTDARTLRPELVLTESIVKIKMQGEDPQEQLERRKYEFDWLNLKGRE